MKKDKKQELKTRNAEQLNVRLTEIISELSKLKIDLSMGTLQNTRQIRALKYELSLIKTILSQKSSQN
jgi:ribosomal protein L29